MDDLIERLKAATEGNAELSAEIARDVVGLKFHEWPNWVVTTSRIHDFPALVWCPAYTESLDAAVTLVPEGLEWDVSFTRVPNSPPGQAIVYVKPFWGSSDHDRDTRVIGEAATPALALCIAALMAREVG